MNSHTQSVSHEEEQNDREPYRADSDMGESFNLAHCDEVAAALSSTSFDMGGNESFFTLTIQVNSSAMKQYLHHPPQGWIQRWGGGGGGGGGCALPFRPKLYINTP